MYYQIQKQTLTSKKYLPKTSLVPHLYSLTPTDTYDHLYRSRHSRVMSLPLLVLPSKLTLIRMQALLKKNMRVILNEDTNKDTVVIARSHRHILTGHVN